MKTDTKYRIYDRQLANLLGPDGKLVREKDRIRQVGALGEEDGYKAHVLARALADPSTNGIVRWETETPEGSVVTLEVEYADRSAVPGFRVVRE